MGNIALADEYITRRKLAEELGLRLRGRPFAELTLVSWERRGEGPLPTRVGRTVLYRASTVEAWLKSQEKGAAPTKKVVKR